MSDAERRARIARRHALAPATREDSPEAVTRAMGVLHATEPPTVHLSVLARSRGLSVADVDRALYSDRSLVKQLAMRRTLFVFPRELLPAAWGSASARVAGQHAASLVKAVEAGGLTVDGGRWLAAARAAVIERLASGEELSAQRLREELPALQGSIEVSPGKPYGGVMPIAPRVLTQLGVEGRIVRGRNDGHWRVSRPLWTSMESWLGEVPEPTPVHHGYARLVHAWLRTFGPGTRADLQWWLGSTVGAVDQALAEVGAVEVALERGATGWLLPDDLEPEAFDEEWGALLPVLDPTVMGWKERDFYLGAHASALFDRNGNAGTTAWWNGRVVGCWVQEPDGEARVALLEDVGAEARTALETEAARITAFCDGVKVSPIYASPAMRAAVS